MLAVVPVPHVGKTISLPAAQQMGIVCSGI